MNPNCSSFSPFLPQTGTQASTSPAPYNEAEEELSYPQPQQAVPQYAITHSDMLCDFFSKVNLWDAQGKPNFDTRIPIPPFNFSESLSPLLLQAKKQKLTALSILKCIQQFIEKSGIPETTFSFQDGSLPVLFDRCGYLHQIFYSIGVELPFSYGSLLDKGMQHQSPECLVWVSNTNDLQSICDFLRYRLSIPCKINDDSITIRFNTHPSLDFKLKIVLKGIPCQEDLSLDISGFIKNIHSPSPLIVKNPNAWEGILHFITSVSKEKNWFQLIHAYTKGQRTLSHEDEAIAMNLFKSSLPASTSVKTIAQKFIQEFPLSVVHDGNTFLTIAMQLIISSQFTDLEAADFYEEILPQLSKLDSLTDPILKRAALCFKKSIPFSHIQATLVLSALKGTFETLKYHSSTVVRSAGQDYLQLHLHESGQTLLLPFTLRKAFEDLQYACLTGPESNELKTLYLAAMNSLNTPIPDPHLPDYVKSHQAYLDLQDTIDSSCTTSPPMIAHFYLVAPGRKDLQNVLLRDFTNLLSSEFRTYYLNSLRRHSSPIISKLARSIADNLDSPNEAMDLMIATLLSDDDERTRALAYPYWTARIQEVNRLNKEQLEQGYVLLEAVINGGLWTQSLKILNTLSKKSVFLEKRLLTAHLRLYKAFASCSTSSEKSSCTHSLTLQLKYTLINRKVKGREYPDLPSQISFPVFEMIQHAIGCQDAGLACDLYMLVLEAGLFDRDLINIRLLGSIVLKSMTADKEQTPMFTATFLQYLVKNDLWIQDTNRHIVMEVADALADSEYPESTLLLSFCLQLIEGSNIQPDESAHCASLHRRLVEKIMNNFNPKISTFPQEDKTKNIEQLFEAANHYIAKETRHANQSAFILLTDTSHLLSWVEKPNLYAEAASAWLEKNPHEHSQQQAILKNVCAIANPIFLSHAQLTSITKHLCRQLKGSTENEIDKTFVRSLVEVHYWLVSQMIDQGEKELAAEFILALKPYFEDASWDNRLIPLILSELPKSQELFDIVHASEAKLTNVDQSLKAEYLCRLGIDYIESNEVDKAVCLVDELNENFSFKGTTEEAREALIQFIQRLTLIPGQANRAAKALNFAISETNIEESSLRSCTLAIAKLFIEEKMWANLNQWMKRIRASVNPEIYQEILQFSVEHWLKNPNEETGAMLIDLIKDHPMVTFDQLEKVMSAVRTFHGLEVKRDVVSAWTKLERDKDLAPEEQTAGWLMILSFPVRALSAETFQKALVYTPSDSDPQRERFYQAVFNASLEFFVGQRGKPEPSSIKKLIVLSERPSINLKGKQADTLFSQAVKARLPVEALRFYKQHSAKIKNQTQVNALPAIARALRLINAPIDDFIIEQLCEISKIVPVDTQKNISIEAIAELTKIPNCRTYQTACDLYQRRLAAFDAAFFRKSFLREVFDTLEIFKGAARSTEDLFNLMELIQHPFTLKYAKTQSLSDEYCLKLLNSASQEESIDPGFAMKIVDKFVDTSKKMNQSSPIWRECFGYATRINLLLFQKTGNSDTFSAMHRKLKDLLTMPFSRIKVFPKSRKIDTFEENAIEAFSEMTSLYLLGMEREESNGVESVFTLAQTVQSCIDEVLELNSLPVLKPFIPHIDAFINLSFPNHPEEELFRLQRLNKVFRECCEEDKGVPARDLVKLMQTLNTANAVFGKNQMTTVKDKMTVLQYAFDSLITYTETLELDQREVQELFDQLLFSISSDEPGYKELLTLANESLKPLMTNIIGPKNNFFFETYLYLYNRFLDQAMPHSFDKSTTVMNVVRKIAKLGSPADHVRISYILSNTLPFITSQHFQAITEIISNFLKEQELNNDPSNRTETYVQRLKNLTSFHPSIDDAQKSEFFDAIFEAQLQLITNTHQSRHPHVDHDPLISLALQWLEHGITYEFYNNNPYSLTEKALKLKSFILERKNPLLLRQTFDTLIKFPAVYGLPDHKRKERADLHFQLFVQASMVDPDKSHQQLGACLNKFLKSTSVFDGFADQVALIRKTF